MLTGEDTPPQARRSCRRFTQLMQLPRMKKAAPADGSARTGGTMRADGPDLRAGGAAMTDVMITTPTGQMPAAALRKSLRATLRPARIPGWCWASPQPPPCSPGAGAEDDILQ